MKEYGTVTAVHGRKAQVTIARSAMCGDCGACQVGRENLTMEASAENQAGAKPGDEVAVEMEFTNVRYLSMGMSGDYPIAVEEGANLVRIGSKIFSE